MAVTLELHQSNQETRLVEEGFTQEECAFQRRLPHHCTGLHHMSSSRNH